MNTTTSTGKGKNGSTGLGQKHAHDDIIDVSPSSFGVAKNSKASSTDSDVNIAKEKDSEEKSSRMADDTDTAEKTKKADSKTAQLKSKIDQVRDRVMEALQSLYDHKADALNIPRQIKKNPVPFAIAGAGTLLALIAGITILVSRRHAKPPTLAGRLRAVGQAWQHPDRVVRATARAIESSETMDRVRGTLAGVFSFIAAEATKLGLAKLAEKSKGLKQSL